MRKILVLLFLSIPAAAQTIAPSQIKPGSNGQSIQTVGGKAAWANNSTSVSSVFGRTGDIIPVTGDYNCSQITSAICSLPSLFNQTIDVDGTALTQRAKLNFINGSAGTVVCVDNPVTLATDCTVTGGSTTGVTWSISNVSGSHTVGSSFPTHNTSAWPMFVGGSLATTGSGTGSITVAQGPTTFAMTLVDWQNQSTATVSSGSAGFSAVIAPGNYYVVTVSGAVTTSIQSWTEMVGTGGGGGGGGGGFTAAGDLSGTSSSQTVVGLEGIKFCSGFTPTNGQFIELTTGSSPNPCWTATTPSGSGNTTSTSLTTNRVPKANGANSIIDSTFFDASGTAGTTNPFTAPAVNTVINAGSSLSAAVTACGSANTTIQITQTIAVGTGITVPPNCTLQPDSAGLLTGTSITINGPIIASKHQIFGSGLAVTLGPITSAVPIEWFGGKGDATGSVGVGTDNLAPFNAAHTALTAGCIDFGIGGYRFSGVATVTKVNMCVEGQTFGYPATAGGISANSSNLWIDTAGGDGLFYTSTASWGIIRNLAVLRTQTPTGTAKGIRIEAFGATLKNLISQDSIYPTYFHGASNAIVSVVDTGWGFTGMAGTPSPNVCGFFVDSSGGLGSSSIQFLNDNASSNLSGAGFSTGLCAIGTSLSDLYALRFETAHTNIGIDLENTGTSSFVSQDIQLVNSVLNTCITECLKINGMGSTTDIAPHVYVAGGNFFYGGIGALIENSSNVSMTGVQIASGNSNTDTDISLISDDGFQINDNQMDGASLVNVSCLNSTHGTVNNNQIKTAGTATGIKNVGCADVAEQGNSIAGNGTALAVGMSFDSGSSNNGPWSSNNIDAATVTTPVSDAGTNNNVMKPTTLISGTVTDSALTAGQQVVAGASGLLSNGGTAILACADTSASGTAQSCTTSPSFTPAAKSCVIYTTTTANSGAGLTLNVNSLGAKSVAKWLGTTTLVAGDVAANSPQLACYNGTVWNLSTIGNAPSGAGGVTFPQTVSGTVNSGGLVYANSGTQISVSAAGPAGHIVDWGGAGTAPTDSGLISSQVATINPGSVAISTIMKSGGSGSGQNLVASLATDNASQFTYTGATGVESASLTGTLNYCPDTSGSGTAQVCSLVSNTLTPVTGTCIVYTTTTANSGAGLTLNVSGIGPKSIAIPGASGWTTTLTVGIIAANKPTLTCYDGTNWNVQQTGTSASAPVASVFGRTGAVVATSGDYTAAQVTGAAVHVANGTSALGTGAISSATCATVVTTTATGTATTDVVGWGFNGDPTAVTGYVPLTTGMLTIIAYPSSGNVNFKVCNNTSASITPGAITLNWTVIR